MNINVLNIDLAVTAFFHNLLPHTSFFELFFSFFSLIGSFAVIWISIGIILAVVQELRHRRYIVTVAGALFTTLVVTYLMKMIFGRARPIDIFAVSPACPADFSFPSLHASLAFAGAVIFSHFDPKRRPLYYTIAIIISYSRIYLGCHFFFDVAAGALIGYFISRSISRVAK